MWRCSTPWWHDVSTGHHAEWRHDHDLSQSTSTWIARYWSRSDQLTAPFQLAPGAEPLNLIGRSIARCMITHTPVNTTSYTKHCESFIALSVLRWVRFSISSTSCVVCSQSNVITLINFSHTFPYSIQSFILCNGILGYNSIASGFTSIKTNSRKFYIFSRIKICRHTFPRNTNFTLRPSSALDGTVYSINGKKVQRTLSFFA